MKGLALIYWIRAGLFISAERYSTYAAGSIGSWNGSSDFVNLFNFLS